MSSCDGSDGVLDAIDHHVCGTLRGDQPLCLADDLLDPATPLVDDLVVLRAIELSHLAISNHPICSRWIVGDVFPHPSPQFISVIVHLQWHSNSIFSY